MFIQLLFALFIYNVHSSATHVITVYGDVYKDKYFFTETFPWIIDNIGGEIAVNFWMQGSGRYTVPQMCALADLRDNTFLQAQYLKCVAEERTSSSVCLCEAGIHPLRFRECVSSRGSLAAESAATFQQVGVDVSPLIELGPKSTVFGVEDTWYLKKICTVFGENPPRGCTKPFSCNGTEALKSVKAISQFDKCCSDCECEDSDDITSTTTFTTAENY